jgi:proteasome assembly chaperone (PAC2) family protein
MNETDSLHDPWLLAVWPGMGGVAISAGYYLMAKLGMHLLAELPANGYFEHDHIEIKDGLIVRKRLPRSRLFLWSDPEQRHDLVLFIGEAQPVVRGGDFCRKLVAHASSLGVSHVFTFAAMATRMRPASESHVFGAAVDKETLTDLGAIGIHMMKEGAISGLNGVLLGTAAAVGMRGGCLLGEIPHVFSQIPFPKASLAVLGAFTRLASIPLDFRELRDHAKSVERTLEAFLERMEQAAGSHETEAEPATETPLETEEAPRPTTDERRHLEQLFEIARDDRARAYELKQELDRIGVFAEYEDRFLDLFKEC